MNKHFYYCRGLFGFHSRRFNVSFCGKCGCFFEMKEFKHGIRIEDNKAYATCPCCQESCWCIIGLKDTSFVKYI